MSAFSGVSPLSAPCSFALQPSDGFASISSSTYSCRALLSKTVFPSVIFYVCRVLRTYPLMAVINSASTLFASITRPCSFTSVPSF